MKDRLSQQMLMTMVFFTQPGHMNIDIMTLDMIWV